MPEFKGTPGPWNISFHGSANCWVVDSDEVSAIAKVVKYNDSATIQKANFHLIAAAPDLLRIALSVLHADELNEQLKVDASTAIKKALGG